MFDDAANEAQDLLRRVEQACQSVGLYPNVSKTKYRHLNPSSQSKINILDGSLIEFVSDLIYLGGYTNISHDINVRIGQAWSAINAMNKIRKSPIKRETRTKLFKQTVETILLYGSDSWTLTKSLSKSLDG